MSKNLFLVVYFWGLPFTSCFSSRLPIVFERKMGMRLTGNFCGRILIFQADDDESSGSSESGNEEEDDGGSYGPSDESSEDDEETLAEQERHEHRSVDHSAEIAALQEEGEILLLSILHVCLILLFSLKHFVAL